MRVLQILFAVGLFVVAQGTPRQDLVRSLVKLTAAPANPCSSNPKPVARVCSSRFSVLCNGKSEISRQDCSLSPSGPYCDSSKGTCSSSTKFYCLQDGIFPDLTNCSQYIVCQGNKATANACPNGSKFNPSVKSCSNYPNPPLCLNYNCSRVGDTRAVTYGPKSQYYAVCLGGAPIISGVCPTGQSYNVTNDACQPDMCLQEGVAPGKNATLFTYCLSNKDGSFTSVDGVCPENLKFNSTKGYCSVQ